MALPRRTRIAVLAAASALAGVALFAFSGTGKPGHLHEQRVAASSGTSTPTTTVPPTSTTTVPARDRTYPVDQASVSITAHNDAGTAVTIPTRVWYPEGAAGRKFPLVIFSPGYQISPTVYDSLTQTWAAAGYVVAEPTYPDTAPGSPEIEYDMVNHPEELKQVLAAIVTGRLDGDTPFAGLVDAAEVAVAGQSDGGDVSLAAAANTCCAVPGIKAAIILSGAEATLFRGSYFSAGNPPLLAIQGDRDTINPPACSAQLYDGASAPRFYLDLPGATHLSAYTGAGAQQTVVEKVTVAFLDRYLKAMSGRAGQLAVLGDAPGESQLTSAAAVPVSGTCPGSPGGG